jgi:DNA polymerase-3 subunit gamma/tau
MANTQTIQIKLAPTAAKKKIYIIDEAHMLTTEASNALLKTLEEPPEHVIFVLATTNPEKLIDTIRSRAVSVNFRKATEEEILSSLKRVVTGEKVSVSESVLKDIAKKAGGAFRDGVKILEQVIMEGEESINKFREGEEIFLKDLYQKNRQNCIHFIRVNIEKGLNIENLLKNITLSVQNEILNGKIEMVGLAELLIEASAQMKNSPIEELPLEIAIVKWCLAERDPALQDNVDEIVVELDAKASSEAIPTIQASAWDNEEVWRSISSTIKPVNASLEALLRSSKPLSYNGNTLTLGVFYKFHKERLEEASHRKVVEEITSKVLNSETRIVCTLMDAPIIAPLTEDKDKDIIRVAEEIFS